jgi:hypothetical protein
VVIDLVWLFVLTGLVPLLLARYRGDRLAAFGLDAPRGGWTAGLALVVPIAVLGVLRQFVALGATEGALLGRVGGAGFTGFGPTTAVAGLLVVVVSTAAALLLTTFLVVRGREAFRSPDTPLTELLRTFGVGACVAALGLGLLRAIGPGRLLPTVLQVVGLVAVVLVADRLVPQGRTAPRAAVLTPMIALVVIHVFAFGGLFRGNLLTGLYAGALAAGVAVVTAVLLESRQRAWAVVPLFLALHWWPSCLSPLPMEFMGAGC